MAEKESVFSSKIKYTGLFSFSNLYQFCYDWLTEEFGLDVAETKYSEKIKGDSKDIEIDWKCFDKVTDYFAFEVKVSFMILGLKEVEVVRDGNKTKTNKGMIELKCKGSLVRDYDGKFETTPFKKFMRSVYEKWIITSRIDQFEEKLIGDCDEFLGQTKAFLDLEGKR